MVMLPVLVAQAVGLFLTPLITGMGRTLMTVVVIHPLLLVYVMVAVPVATPVTTPVLLTVATPVFDETQGFVADGAAEPVRVIVAPTQTLAAPVMVGNELTVTVSVSLQLLLFVKIISAVPALMPVTTPVVLTVATVVFELTQGFDAAGVPVADKLIVDPTHTLAGPEITGAGLLTKGTVSLVRPHSLFTWSITR